MKKRLLSGLLVCCMAISMAPTAFAATATVTEAAEVLAALDIMVGDDNGNLNLDQQVTRAQFSKMSVASTVYGDYVGDTVSISPYPDVSKDNWAAPWISTAVELGLVKGNLYGYFEPDRSITLAEGVTIVLRLLGYEDSAFTGVWPAGQMAQYYALDLDEGITCGQNDAMDRQDAMYLFYNMMTTPTATGSGYYLNTIEPGLVDANGDIDRLALINTAMSGPVVAESGWQSKVPFDTTDATVYRNGVLSSLSALTTLDVVYWSESMNSIWAYNDTVSGLYQSVSPTASSPTSIVVAGQTYAIEASSAAYDLSTLGDYSVGDNVTLLLGRDGGIAAVRDSGNATSSILYGVVTESTRSTYEDGSGQSYTTNAITMLTTGGDTFTYPVDGTYFSAGDAVRVTFSTSGTEVKRLSTTTISGKVSVLASKIGSYNLADDVEILDVYSDTGVTEIQLSRLANLELTTSMVKFYATNADGEITHLILNDATGDNHTYGILTDVSETNVSMVTVGLYTVDIAGYELTVYKDNKVFGVTPGACIVKGALDDVDIVSNLTSISIESIVDKKALTSKNQSLTIWDDALVYEVIDGEYYPTTLERVSTGDYSLVGYYDKAESEGGRIRIILAK